MSYARVESSVRTNPKFITAGPAPSWLWLCGILYCQEALTDGFIADATIDYLGVKNARRLAGHLVRAGLWEVVPGGWLIHHYLKHNKPAREVERIKKERAEGGRLGGRKPFSSAEGKPSRLTMSETFAVDVDDVVAADVAVGVGGGPEGGQPLDVAFEAFAARYPEARRSRSAICQHLFFQAVSSGKTTVPAMMTALGNHVMSEQWQDAKHIPNMDKWLEGQRWDQRLPPPKTLGTSPRTAGNAAAVRDFVERHHAEK